MLGNIYLFTIVTKNDETGNIRNKFSVISRSPNNAVCAIVHFRNTKHDGSGIIFESSELHNSDMFHLIRGGVSPDASLKYYGYIKANESDILSALKSIKSSR